MLEEGRLFVHYHNGEKIFGVILKIHTAMGRFIDYKVYESGRIRIFHREYLLNKDKCKIL